MKSTDVAALTLVQISDFHLGERTGETLLGMDADQSLADVLALIAAQQQAVALLLATGDLANHGSESAYQRVQHYLHNVAAPVLYLPGNHDDLPLLQNVLGVSVFPQCRVIANGATNRWQIIALNSAVPKQVGGAIDAAQLAALKAILDDNHLPTVIALHHPPQPIACAWLDPQCVSNGDALLELLASYPQVKVVLSGHVHQDGEFRYAHLPVYSAPSTCIQFLPRSDGFALDNVNPGYRWLRLLADGRFETGVQRVDGCYRVDHNASGY
jgi:Icc protein